MASRGSLHSHTSAMLKQQFCVFRSLQGLIVHVMMANQCSTGGNTAESPKLRVMALNAHRDNVDIEDALGWWDERKVDEMGQGQSL